MKSKKQLPKLKVKKLVDDAKLPTRAYEGDAGYDLYASKEVTIQTNRVGKIPTGIAIEIPEGYWVKFYDRSGFFTQVQVDVGAGVIDNGYRGELIVCMFNGTTQPVRINKGEAFAQFAFHELITFEVKEVQDWNNTITERGDKGFASSD